VKDSIINDGCFSIKVRYNIEMKTRFSDLKS